MPPASRHLVWSRGGRATGGGRLTVKRAGAPDDNDFTRARGRSQRLERNFDASRETSANWQSCRSFLRSMFYTPRPGWYLLRTYHGIELSLWTPPAPLDETRWPRSRFTDRDDVQSDTTRSYCC